MIRRNSQRQPTAAGSRSGIAVILGLVVIFFSGAVLASLMTTLILTGDRADRKRDFAQLDSAIVAALQQMSSQPLPEPGTTRHWEFSVPNGAERITVDITPVITPFEDSADSSQPVEISSILWEGSQQICEQHRREFLPRKQEQL